MTSNRQLQYGAEVAPRRVLLISGSTRAGSTNSALLRTAIECLPPAVTGTLYPALAELPQFNPDLDAEPLPPLVLALRAGIEAATAVLFCTPEYAGTLPGSFKNLLDWTVGATVLTDKPVAWVNAAADPRRGNGAHATLATVLGYVQASIVADACRSVPVAHESIGADGRIHDESVRRALRAVLTVLLE